ncbi:MAG: UDP-N-acetylmuramoyl-L-alanyl-D-glutamate--2,6-diaminopimelate ligase [Clostridia bacterium]|nr:UDP-N-acetylmuramoyl-L-alanyl-D-glutamate--2,6-diaminopimelate ligase [Clostridia bacterium]MDE7328331.1 UDP-N-acetylmuramoyl-L-alanyl-D-glutamate--2,6-diaminopimelate ligase [Clostridia bacterium]
MLLSKLLQNCDIVDTCGELDIQVEKVKINSREVNEGDCFICLVGSNSDGHNFANEAIARGAKAVICCHDYANTLATVVRVKDTRKAYSVIASNFYGNPSQKLKIITVVGTNGKSTTAYVIKELLQRNGISCGLIGTMYYEYNDVKLASNLTTPDPITLQELFAKMAASGVEYVVMELSAHAIYLEKLYGIVSEMSIFTNLSQDHLDFFGNMSEYGSCKKSYFNKNNARLAIVNVDDPLGLEIIKEEKLPIITYGLDNPSDAFAINVTQTSRGETFVANVLDDILDIDCKFFGKFNIYNLLAALVAVKKVGLSNAQIMQTLRDVDTPEGRFNVVRSSGITYVVDFAHTPDGIFNLLKEGRNMTKKRVITIFGCGGDRDVTKRPIMGKIASEMSDIVIVTSDNPRTESREGIAGDILQGVNPKGKLYVELDRAKAIKLGVELADEGDVVFIAGKGSENYIDENNIKVPYSDMQEVRRWIS